MRAANGRVRNRATLFILAALVVGSALGPMLWAISTSLKNEVNAVSAIPSLIPSPATFANYLSVFSHKTFVIELLNSVLYAAGAVAVATVVGIVGDVKYEGVDMQGTSSAPSGFRPDMRHRDTHFLASVPSC